MATIPTSGTYLLATATFTHGTGGANGGTTSTGQQEVTYGDGYIIVGTTRYEISSVIMASGTNGAYAAYVGGIVATDGTVILLAPSGYDSWWSDWVMSSTYDSTSSMFAITVRDRNTTYLNTISNYNYTNGQGQWNFTCFLAGTMISTPSGHILVEDIVPGTEVLTYDKDGKATAKKVKFLGKGLVSTSPFATIESPVRIKKDAFGNNVPFKDCLLTSEHCLYINGCFVPARMLVNNQSIYYDKSFSEYEYYHVELEDHSILQSDGILSESYLRTGVGFFDETMTDMDESLIQIKSWDKDASASLNVDRSFVEPIYQKLLSRAKEMGVASLQKNIITSSEPYIIDQHGNHILASKVNGNKHLFLIKQGADVVTIRSDHSKPSETIGAFVDDRRELGLLIGEISLLTSDNLIKYTEHLKSVNLYGWYGRECSNMRWTNGNAQLANLGMETNFFISIEIIDQMPSIEKLPLAENIFNEYELVETVA